MFCQCSLCQWEGRMGDWKAEGRSNVLSASGGALSNFSYQGGVGGVRRGGFWVPDQRVTLRPVVLQQFMALALAVVTPEAGFFQLPSTMEVKTLVLLQDNGSVGPRSIHFCGTAGTGSGLCHFPFSPPAPLVSWICIGPPIPSAPLGFWFVTKSPLLHSLFEKKQLFLCF